MWLHPVPGTVRKGQVTCSLWNPLVVLEAHSVPAARTTPEITEPPVLTLPGRSPLRSQMGEIRPSRSLQAQAAGPPPFCPAMARTGPPQAGQRMEGGVGAQEQQCGKTRWAVVTVVSEVPAIHSRALPSRRKGKERERRKGRLLLCMGLWAWLLGLCACCPLCLEASFPRQPS